MKILLIVLSIIGLTASCLWYSSNPGWEPVAGVVASLITLVYAIIFKKSNGGNTKMTQRLGDHSTGYQSGRDIKIKK